MVPLPRKKPNGDSFTLGTTWSSPDSRLLFLVVTRRMAEDVVESGLYSHSLSVSIPRNILSRSQRLPFLALSHTVDRSALFLTREE